MDVLTTAAIFVTSSLALGVVGLKRHLQKRLDQQRTIYRITFPNDLAHERMLAWLQSISGSLTAGRSRIFGVPTLVFETLATDHGITHRLSMPWQSANYIVGQLRTHIPGIRAEPEDHRPVYEWKYVAEIGMSKPVRTLSIPNQRNLSASLLASVQALKVNEVVLTQWVLTPAAPEHLPSKDIGSKTDTGLVRHAAYADEIADRRIKLEQPNMLAVGRLAAKAETPVRARHLVDRVQTALASTRNSNTHFETMKGLGDAVGRVNRATAPYFFPAQLTISELSGLVAWPIGQPFIAGLPQGSSRHLPANEAIGRLGRIVGRSNFPGDERPIAISRTESLKHLHIIGPTGVGKTTLLANLIEQDMREGYGAIVMESKGDLFQAALDYVPANRLDDVIVLDVNDRSYPVGFNILEQGNPRVVIDQVTDLFQSLYTDTRGVWMRKLLFHGLYTLAENGGMTFVDLAALISPMTRDEVAWSDDIRRGVKDNELKQFWQSWENLPKTEQDRNASPLHNRIWQLISRPELRNIIGQGKSSFQMADVVAGNKILLINLAGVPREAASLAGTLIMNALWHAVQTTKATRPNFLYLDEFQDFMRLPVGADEMLAKARGFNLGMSLAHQHLDQLSPDLRSAVMNNARSKVVFQTGAEDGKIMQRAFGSASVSELDFMQLQQYEAIARLATDSGVSAPVTMMTNAPTRPTGTRAEVLARSRRVYGRALNEVEADMQSRRSIGDKPGRIKPNIGIRDWGK